MQSANKAAAGNDALDFREQWHKNGGGERTTMANFDRISWERNSESSPSSATLTLSIKKGRRTAPNPPSDYAALRALGKNPPQVEPNTANVYVGPLAIVRFSEGGVRSSMQGGRHEAKKT